jgi:hypothetical protein
MTGSPVPSIAFVTRVDAEMFGQLFLLLGSLRRNSPGVWLYVCDLGLDQAPGFKRALSALDPKLPYLNSGLIICRSRSFLARWATLCEALPCEFLFEQNAFNLAGYEKPGQIHMLDPWVWNLAGTTFRSVEIVRTGEDVAVIGQSGGVNILHATSSERANDLALYDYHITVNDTLFRPRIQVIKCFDTLLKYQLSLVDECIATEAPALIASGFGSPGEPVLGPSGAERRE